MSKFQIFLIFLLLLMASFLGMMLLYKSRTSSWKWRKKTFYIPSSKSNSNAQLLGGLPLSLSLYLVAAISLYFESSQLDMSERSMFLAFFLAAPIIILYGYIDDLFEISARTKLFCQVIATGIFAFTFSFNQEASIPIFLITSFFTMALVNGCNLLDGLDTMTIKWVAGSLFSYAIIAIDIESTALFSLTTLSTAPLIAFYVFNKAPSKIHLGEIGGSFLGLYLAFLSSLTFWQSAPSKELDVGIAMAFSPILLPITEVFISFSRRIMQGRSPFSGDKFHLHHLLNNHLDLGVKKTTYIIALIAFTPGPLLYTVHNKTSTSPLISMITYAVGVIIFYALIGKKIWFRKPSTEDKSIDMGDAENTKIIDTSLAVNFEIHLMDEEFPDTEDDDAA